MDWLMVGSLATVTQAATFLVAAAFAYRQLKEVAQSRSGDSLARVLDQLTTPPLKEQIAWVLSKDFPREGREKRADLDRMNQVSYAYNRVGLFVRHKLIPKQIVLDMWCVEIVNCWDRLRPFIERQRKERNFQGFQNQFEELYKLACDYESPYYPQPREHKYLGSPHED